jgi:hypothetical protein
MPDQLAATRLQVTRQIAHWRAAAVGLADPESFASAQAWRSLENYLGTALRSQLGEAVTRLQRQGDALAAESSTAGSDVEWESLRRAVIAFRGRYQHIETALDFYCDAVNTRTSARLAALLRACDTLARRSLDAVLGPLGRPTPPMLTYLDRGFGASILRAGLRLWDGQTLSTAAAIKITRHNLHRPTALLHEAGHQAAFMLAWNEELADALRAELADTPELASTWAGWASEIAADTFAFAHSGYASVAALHDVIAGDDSSVYAFRPLDPHPVAYLRVLLGTAMSVREYGAGPWDDLGRAWVRAYPVDRAPAAVQPFLTASVRAMPRIAEVCLRRPYAAFGGRAITDLADPGRVSPEALMRLERDAGPSLFESPYWIDRECLRLLARSGYRAATEPRNATAVAGQFETWMLRLGREMEMAK